MRLKDRVALVIGADAPVGAAICLKFVQEGAAVCIMGADGDRLKTLADRASRLYSGQVVAFAGAVDGASDIQHATERIVDMFGAVHVLVNAAMDHGFALVEDVSDEIWEKEQNINLKSTHLSIRAATPIMKAQRYGRIVTVSSTAKDGVPWFAHMGHSTHAAARGGILGLTRALAYELGHYEITVNCVVPGPIEHEGSAKTLNALREDADAALFPTQMMALKRLGTPEDVANAALFLASDEASYVTGNAIYVSGGLYAG